MIHCMQLNIHIKLKGSKARKEYLKGKNVYNLDRAMVYKYLQFCMCMLSMDILNKNYIPKGNYDLSNNCKNVSLNLQNQLNYSYGTRGFAN